MNSKELNIRQDISTDNKLNRIYTQFSELLNELRKKELNKNIERSINESIDNLNSSTLSGTQLTKLVKQKQTAILKQVEKEQKIVPKNYYRTMWMLFGMSGIGLPIGVAFGLSIGNIGLLGLGLPIGMAIGLAIGMSLDKKALNEGRQLDIEIKN
ncbi:hypothetical protein [Flavobacterium muglaense]|uniref:Glycine zipper family protein n=1 Tax=Flavobacterium muglaense TaxID=2764716 RepID=A0A923SEA8_9FLAO|nr:hypothetical protein [Flavobacterium muglaense]MBC5836529.1 hypothetical protein [Flavobacterium muglaense]MBC5843205.1 hypothetical protein [Flavobacterium muglaense]